MNYESTPFIFQVRVYYEDTDAAGVVYYANYLKFIERARSEWLRTLGFELDALEQQERVVFPVRSLEARYDKPARLGELLDIETSLTRMRKASFELVQVIKRKNDQLFSCRVTIACVDSERFRPKPIPAPVQYLMSPWKTQ